MKKINFKNSSFIIFLIISLWYAIGNFFYWYIYTPIFVTRMDVVHFSDIFFDAFLYYNAPLITWIMKFMFFVFGRHYYDLQIIIINYLFFLIGLYFIYKIGFELKDKKTGNIAMILFALTPAVYGMSRQYGHQDWHVMIAVVVNIYCLMKLDDFKDRKWSVIYGITVGLGLLIKDEFLAYFFVPWLYVVIKSLIERAEKYKILNIIITIVLGSIISGCHYFRIEIINKILHEPVIEQVHGSIFDFENFRILTIGLSEYLLSPVIFVFFIIGLLFFVFKYRNKHKYILLLWFFIPWMIIMLMLHHKEAEYGLGFVPAMIFFCTVFISNIKNKYFKYIIVSTVVLVGILQYLNFSYGICNLKLFNSQFFYKQNNIFYYDKKFINYNVMLTGKEYLFSLYNRIKKYKEYRVLFYYVEESMTFVLRINNIVFRDALFLDKDILAKEDYDIFVKTNTKFKTIDDILNVKHILGLLPKKYSIEKEKNKILDLQKYLEDNFEIIEESYILNIPKEENLIQIYKNKRLIKEENQ